MKKVTFLAFFLALLFGVSAQRLGIERDRAPKDARVLIETNYGNIVVALYNDTPLHRENFLRLVHDGVYDGLLFHRVISQFMVQAGDPASRDAKPGQMLGSGTLGYKVPSEIRSNHLHKRGALCAAREGDEVNPFRESSATQFYIVQGTQWNPRSLDEAEKRLGHRLTKEQRELYSRTPGCPHLDGDYTVFGEVVEGMDVVDRIAAVTTDSNNRPLEDVKILHMQLIKK